MSWRDSAQDSKFIKLDEGMYVTVTLDLVNVNTDLNQWDRKVWDFWVLDDNLKKTGNVLRASQALLNRLHQATEGMKFATVKIKRTGTGKEVKYEVSAEDIDPEQTRFV